jgi:uncharacterized membrane-anchored protein
MNTSRVAGIAHALAGRQSRVPEITIYFWIVKLLTTAMGEATSDYFVYHMNPYVAVTLGGLGFVIALAVQLATGRYIAWVYWLLVVMVAIFGTMVADVVHIVLGVPYRLSTAGFAAALTIIFIAWRQAEGTLSIHSIYSLRRELFYWATVIATFALGTAAGDMTATTLHLGYFVSGLLFALLFALPALLYWRFGLNEISAFWLAYVITRPLGASFADWFGRAPDFGGLGYGTGLVSMVLTIAIIIQVAYLTLTRKDVQRSAQSLRYAGTAEPAVAISPVRPRID